MSKCILIEDPEEARVYLSRIGIHYESWKASIPLSDSPTSGEILSAYSKDIEKLKNIGGYNTADVIDMNSATEGLDAMLEKRIRAIRLFQNKSGWTPYYSGSGLDARYQPVCMGPAYVKRS